jgi:hypothetical protein
MTLECDVREDLMLEYIRAGNRLVDLKHREGVRDIACARGLAAVLVDRALAQRNQARERLLKHCGEHGC